LYWAVPVLDQQFWQEFAAPCVALTLLSMEAQHCLARSARVA
jgi:hypothetical protein